MAHAESSLAVVLAASPQNERAIASASANPERPHILLALDQLSATLGGGERVVLRLARLLPAWGFRVSVLTLSLDPRSPVLKDPPCPVYVLPLQRTWDFAALKAARELRRFLRQQKIALVQTFFESSDLWVGGVAKTVPGIRLIWSRRDMGILRDRKHEIAYRLLRRMPDRVLAVSEEVRQHCIEIDGVAPERVQTLYNGIDLPLLKSKTTPRRSRENARYRTLVSVGNVRPVKGFDVLVEAAIPVLQRFPDATFKIAGALLDTVHHAAIVERAMEAGVADRFLFLGNVDNIRALLEESDIFVLPSRSEGFSNAIIEAMACSLPVVATRVGGNAEAVLDGTTGLIVPPENPAALAAALEHLLGDHAQAASMGAAGYERVVSLFTTEAMLSALVAVYETVLNTN